MYHTHSPYMIHFFLRYPVPLLLIFQVFQSFHIWNFLRNSLITACFFLSVSFTKFLYPIFIIIILLAPPTPVDCVEATPTFFSCMVVLFPLTSSLHPPLTFAFSSHCHFSRKSQLISKPPIISISYFQFNFDG